MSNDRRITVGVTTRNRPESLVRCLRSISLIQDIVEEIIVVDDAADSSLAAILSKRLADEFLPRLRIISQCGNLGYIVARNRIAREAATDFILNLDDDAVLLSRSSIISALETMQSDTLVGAVAFAQAEADGKPWSAKMQPAPVSFPCLVPTFIGFAHLLRRQLFLSLGGYRELFEYYGEEKEFCLRMLEHGHSVVYLPHALVGHIPDSAGRNHTRYIRYFHRNDCLSALYNLPFPVMLTVMLQRVLNFGSVARKMGAKDPQGRSWLIREIKIHWRDVWRHRKPVSWAVLRRWRTLRHRPPELSPLVVAK